VCFRPRSRTDAADAVAYSGKLTPTGGRDDDSRDDEILTFATDGSRRRSQADADADDTDADADADDTDADADDSDADADDTDGS
jgi:hypothetical protein